MPNVFYERRTWTFLPNTAVVGNRITQTKNAHAWWSFTICSRCNQMKFPTFQCYQTNSKRLILYLLTISSLLLCSYYVYQSFYSAKVVIYFAFCVYCHCKLPYCFEQSGRHCFRKDCQIGVFTTLIYRDLKALK